MESPFAHVYAAPPAAARRSVPLLWLLAAAGLVLAAGVAFFVLKHVASDPYRTLEPFSMENYVGNYHALEGTRFRANLRVENDLGYSAGAGRMMVFTIDGDGRALAALVPTRIANGPFSRGQRYTVALEVGGGGLIQIDSYAKN